MNKQELIERKTFDYNNPVKLNVLKTWNNINGKFKNSYALIEYEGKEYKYAYKTGESYGFAFISENYSGETIYSTTQSDKCTDLGNWLHYCLTKHPIKF